MAPWASGLGNIWTSTDAECKCEYKTERNQLFTKLKTLEAEIENLKKLVGQGASGYGAQMTLPTPPTPSTMHSMQTSPMRGILYL